MGASAHCLQMAAAVLKRSVPTSKGPFYEPLVIELQGVSF